MCRRALPPDEFHKNKNTTDGLASRCKQCARDVSRLWRERNRERDRLNASRWQKENRDAVRAKYKRWYEANKEHVNKWQRLYRQKNLERRREIAREWGRRNRDKTREYWARYQAAKDRRTPQWLTEEHKQAIREIYASAKPGEHVDHIWPLRGKDAWGLHVPWNLQVISAEVNLRKGNRPPAPMEIVRW